MHVKVFLNILWLYIWYISILSFVCVRACARVYIFCRVCVDICFSLSSNYLCDLKHFAVDSQIFFFTLAIFFLSASNVTCCQRQRSPGAPMSARTDTTFNRGVIKSGTDTLKNDCRSYCIPNIIGLEYGHSDDACMSLDQSAGLCLLHGKFVFGLIWSAQQCH